MNMFRCFIYVYKVESKVVQHHYIKTYRGVDVLPQFLASALDGGECTSAAFPPGKEPSVSF